MMTWKIYALASAFFAGLTALFAKIGVRDIPSNFATLFRTIVILMFLFIWVMFRQEWQNPFHLDRKTVFFLVLSGMATGLSWLCYFRALQLGPASLVAPLDKLSLLFAVILSVVILREQLSLIQWGGAMFMAVGALMMALK
jgi:transporter family protein